jgi:ATP-dependent helicase/nuclease subunit A
MPAAATPWTARADLPDRFARGRALHALLQTLPDCPPEDRRTTAARLLTGVPAADEVVAEAYAIMAHPPLAELFGPGSRAEVPIAGVIGGRVVGGLVDRLLVTPTRVVLADWKTARDPPQDVRDTPIAYLRQIAAYAAVLRAIFPTHAVEALLVWTRTATVMPVPHALLVAHAPSAEALDPWPAVAHVPPVP